MSMLTTGSRLVRSEQKEEMADLRLEVGSAAKDMPANSNERAAIAQQTLLALRQFMISLRNNDLNN